MRQQRLPRNRRIAVLASSIAVLVVIFAARNQSRAKAQLAREDELRTNIAAIRAGIGAYRAKHRVNPTSLQELVRDGELRAIPADPITSSNTTWKVATEESVRVDDFQPGAAHAQPTITDVHSGAPGNDSSGKRFADY